MIIFKRLWELKAKYADALNYSEGDNTLVESQLKAVIMLLDMLEVWPKSQKAREYLNDAITMGIEDSALKHNTSKNAVRKMLSVRSKEYTGKIGASTVELIKSGKVREAIINFKLSWGIIKPKDLFMDCLDIRENDIHTAKIEPLYSCMEEVKYLKMYATPTLDCMNEKIDQHKLYSVLHLLFSDTIAYSKEKELLLALFTNQISYGDFKRNIQ